jgi:hypothetical protein
MRGIEAAFWGTLLQDLELKTSASGRTYCNFGCGGRRFPLCVPLSCLQAMPRPGLPDGKPDEGMAQEREAAEASAARED